MALKLKNILEENPDFIPAESFSSIRRIVRRTGSFGSLLAKRRYEEGTEKPTRNNVWLGKIVSDTLSGEEFFYLPELGVYEISMTKGVKLRPDLHFGIGKKQKHTLKHGNVLVYEDFLKQTGFKSVVDSIDPSMSDTLNALLLYKLSNYGFHSTAAETWHDDSFRKTIYPNADLSPGSISKFLKHIGKEKYYDNFFNLYLKYLTDNNEVNNLIGFPILIDGAGPQNDINIPKAAIKDQNGVMNNETRLIYATDKESKLPIFFHYVAGNVIDVNALQYTITTLQKYNINIRSVIMDAGFNSDDNLDYPLSLNINFITRLQEHGSGFKKIINEHGSEIGRPKYLVEYRDKTIYCMKIPYASGSIELYAYLCYDGDILSSELSAYKRNFFENPETFDPDGYKYNTIAKFVLISNHNYDTSEILQNYYQKRETKQFFDLAKRGSFPLPSRAHTEEGLRGRLLVSFIESIILLLSDKRKISFS